MSDERLSRLVNLHLDGQLMVEDLSEMEGMLRGSAAARAQFWRETRLHAQLHEIENGDAQRIVQRTGTPFPRRLRIAASILAVAACLAVLIAGGIWIRRGSGPDQPVEVASTAIAVLSKELNAHWRTPEEAHAVGEALVPGWLRLRSGLVRVECYSGVGMLIEGPADVRLVSVGVAQLDFGRIRADVPAMAHGFSVRTPHVTVVDLGTAFGVHVQTGLEEVQVFTGRVTLQTASGPIHELHAGDAVKVVGGAEPEPMPANSSDYKSPADLDLRTDAVHDSRVRAWREAADRLDGDPTLLVRFSFAKGTITDRTMRNLSSHGAEAGDGTLIGCMPTDGRWPDTQALEFRTQSDRVRLGVPGELHHLTLAAWVRVDAVAHPFNSLFMTDGFAEGALHWQIRGNGSLHFALSGPSGRPADPYNFDSPDIFTADRLGRWTHVVAAYDGPRHELIQYVDGRPIGHFILTGDLAVRIGHGELGNWNPGDSPDGAKIRNLTGRMDEFALFTRTLDAAEVLALYRVSAPHEDMTP
jgi:hypothetical protein